MYEKEKNQVNPRHPSSRKGWGTVFVFTMACLVILLQKIVSLPYEYLVIPVSIIVIPLLTGVFAFYKWLFEFLHTLRQRRPGTLPPASGVYLTAHLTANIRLAPPRYPNLDGGCTGLPVHHLPCDLLFSPFPAADHGTKT